MKNRSHLFLHLILKINLINYKDKPYLDLTVDFKLLHEKCYIPETNTQTLRN